MVIPISQLQSRDFLRMARSLETIILLTRILLIHLTDSTACTFPIFATCLLSGWTRKCEDHLRFFPC